MANRVVPSSVPVSASSTGAAGSVVAIIGANANVGRTVHASGFVYQTGGATAIGNVTITMSYTPATGALVTLGTWVYVQNAGATASNPAYEVNCIPPMQSPQPITGTTNGTTGTPIGSITIQATAGAGTTNAALSLWGFLL